MTPHRAPHRVTAALIERELEWARLQGEHVDADIERDLGEYGQPPAPVFLEAYDAAEWEPWWLVCDSCGWERLFGTEDARADAKASHDCAVWLAEHRAVLARMFPTLDADMDGAA